MSHDLPYHEENGIRYPRLTRILSILRDPDVEMWQEKVGTAVALRRQQQAQRRGTLLHKLIGKTLLTGKEATLPKDATFEVRMCWQAWRRWYRLNKSSLDVQGVETPRVSPTLGYGATPDLWEPSVVTDWKTGSRIQAKHWIQVHSEVPLIYRDKNPNFTDLNLCVKIVRLDPAIGDFEEQIRPFDPAVWETFMNLKQVYLAWYADEMKLKEVKNG